MSRLHQLKKITANAILFDYANLMNLVESIENNCLVYDGKFGRYAKFIVTIRGNTCIISSNHSHFQTILVASNTKITAIKNAILLFSHWLKQNVV